LGGQFAAAGGVDMAWTDPIQYAIPAFIVLILLEMVWAAKYAPTAYDPGDSLTSLLLGLGRNVVGVLEAGLLLLGGMWLYQHRVFDLSAIGGDWGWQAWALCLLGEDLAYYVWHRSAHRVRWFWASHVNHHSSQHYNLTTALRQPWTGLIALDFIFRIPLVLLGFHPVTVLACGSISLIYQFWIHTEAVRRLPRAVEWLFNTPSNHRVHHATNPVYLDRNFGGILMVWDHLFGSYQPEIAGEKAHFGIIKQLGNFNLIWAAFHEWAEMAGDVWRAPWRSKLGYLWRVPGWSHDGSRDTSDEIRGRWLGNSM
jgi:sterol desaturase/sphingolipid hydroxylase (fatty acid hydroxylase superfamily)